MANNTPKQVRELFGQYESYVAGMQIHIRPVARGDKNYVRAIVNQRVTSPAGD